MMKAPVPEPRPLVTQSLELTEDTVVGTVAPILDAIGAEATLKLCARLGGTHFERVSPEIARVIGPELSSRLARALGRGRVVIPRNPISNAARRRAVVAWAASGRTRQEIAIEFGLSERHVYRILAGASAR